MQANVDVVIIGAGITGLCTALQLQRRSGLSIVVYDKGRGPGEGSTGASSAICRHLYTYDELIRLAKYGSDRYSNWPDFLRHPRVHASFQGSGVLWLGQDRHTHEPAAARLARFGIPARLMDDDEVATRFAINPCRLSPDFATGADHDCERDAMHLFEESGGAMDPQDTLVDLIAALTEVDVKVRFNHVVEEILHTDAGVTGVRLRNGDSISSPVVVNASGPWSSGLLAQVGLEQAWPLQPVRIQVVYLDTPEEIAAGLPVCADPVSGIYFRSQNRGQQLIVGSTRFEDDQEAVAQPDEFDRFPDDAFKVRVLHALHHRLPRLGYHGRVNGYCGLYTLNQQDMHPIVGETPLQGLYTACGFSGHGFKLAPAIGAILARQISGVRVADDPLVDDAFLGFGRKPLGLASRSVLA